MVIRVGNEDSGGDREEADLYVKPGSAVAGEHIHPTIEEAFTVLRGRVGFRIAGRESIAQLNQRLVVSPGVAHDWWNAGEEEAHVLAEASGPGASRFVEVIQNLFGLARDGKTNSKGMPNLLQGAILLREFEDAMYTSRILRA